MSTAKPLGTMWSLASELAKGGWLSYFECAGRQVSPLWCLKLRLQVGWSSFIGCLDAEAVASADSNDTEVRSLAFFKISKCCLLSSVFACLFWFLNLVHDNTGSMLCHGVRLVQDCQSSQKVTSCMDFNYCCVEVLSASHGVCYFTLTMMFYLVFVC